MVSLTDLKSDFAAPKLVSVFGDRTHYNSTNGEVTQCLHKQSKEPSPNNPHLPEPITVVESRKQPLTSCQRFLWSSILARSLMKVCQPFIRL